MSSTKNSNRIAGRVKLRQYTEIIRPRMCPLDVGRGFVCGGPILTC